VRSSYSRRIVVCGSFDFSPPPPFSFAPTAMTLFSVSRYLRAVLFIFAFSFRTYGYVVRGGFELGRSWNSRFLLFDAERVRALRPPLSLWEFGLLNRDREFG